jgi:hypothetical protein
MFQYPFHPFFFAISLRLFQSSHASGSMQGFPYKQEHPSFLFEFTTELVAATYPITLGLYFSASSSSIT